MTTRHQLKISHTPGMAGRSIIEIDGKDVADAISAVQVTLTSQGVEAHLETIPGTSTNLELDDVIVHLFDEQSRLRLVTDFLQELDAEFLEDAMTEGDSPGHGALVALRRRASEWARG